MIRCNSGMNGNREQFEKMRKGRLNSLIKELQRTSVEKVPY